MAEETKKTFTIRLPEHIAARVETQAASMNVSPTTLLQSLIVRRFEVASEGDTAALAALSGKLETVKRTCERLEQAGTEQYAEFLFEVVKTRSAIFHSLDQSMGANAVDEIIEASEQTARQYLSRLASAPGGKQ
jgi:hypothetical protein